MNGDVDKWLASGAGVREGLRLLGIYAPNRHLDRLVRLAPERYGYLLKHRLSKFASSPELEAMSRPRRPGAFREQWPFLSEPDCPAELKVLAADKISAYWNYVEGHEQLWNCRTLEECYETARKVVENFLQNRRIEDEFCNWRDRHVLLGKHPVFRQSRRLRELRSLSIVELMRKKKNLEGAIWRVKDEIRKGDRPHLRAARERRLQEKEEQLAEVGRMIQSYEDEYGRRKDRAARAADR